MFNYLIIDYLINQGFTVHAFFIVNEKFYSEFDPLQFEEQWPEGKLFCKYLECHEVPGRFSNGIDYFFAAYKVSFCKSIVRENRELIESADGCLSLNFGWGPALSVIHRKAACIFGDPLHDRLRYRPLPPHKNWFRLALSKLRHEVLLWSMNGIYSQVAKHISDEITVVSFSPYETKMMQNGGLKAKRMWNFAKPIQFANKSSVIDHNKNYSGDKLVLIHVGDQRTTASQMMLKNWRHVVFSALGALPFSIELRLVGKMATDFSDHSNGNLEVISLGRIEDLSDEMANADIFFAPTNYPVGVRTRIIGALSYKLPVITDSSVKFGMPELVDGTNYLCCDTVDDLCNSLLDIHKNPQRLASLSECGYQTWKRWYDPKNNIPALIQLSMGLQAEDNEPDNVDRRSESVQHLQC